jgi:hypothetical protein
MSKKSHKYKKQTIPKALREQCWIQNFGPKFKHTCHIKWCKNTIDVFNYHVGHNIPESKGGKLCLENLKPICSRCNHSMGSQYTITEWMDLDENNKQTKCCWSKKKKKSVTGYKGVYKTKSGKFKAIIHIDGKQKYLGSFNKAIEASRAYKKAINS